MKKNLIGLLLMFVSSPLLAQGISYITTIPQNPTPTDTVLLITKTGTPNLSTIVDYSISISNDTVNLKRCFLIGLPTQPQLFQDTVFLNPLPAGTYQIRYVSYIAFDDSCGSNVAGDTAYHTFTVAGATSIELNEQNNTLCTLFPNPATNQHTLKIGGALQKMVTIDLYDIQGRFIRRVFNENAKQSILDLHLEIKDLINGMYVYSVKTNDKKMHLRFVKQ